MSNSNVYPEAEALTVEKIKSVMDEMEKCRLPHTVYNCGNATLLRGWLQKNKVVEPAPLSTGQIMGRDSMLGSFNGIDVIETPALKFNQMAYVQNGVIKGVFELAL